MADTEYEKYRGKKRTSSTRVEKRLGVVSTAA